MQTKSGFIAIVGRPNVGKSSLMNALVGEKIAIVSDKPQTTRNRITGVLTRGETQLVFLDTPGVHKSRTKLGDYRNRQVTSSVADVDLIVFVTEANRPLNEAEKKLIASFRGMPAVAVLNKIDLLDAPEKLNSDPYGAWIIKVENVTDTEELLDAAAYEAFCAEEG